MTAIEPANQRMSISFSRKRRDFRREDITLGDKDAADGGTQDFPATLRDPKAVEQKLMIDFSCDVSFIFFVVLLRLSVFVHFSFATSPFSRFLGELIVVLDQNRFFLLVPLFTISWIRWSLLFSRVQYVNLAVQTKEIDETPEYKDEQFYSKNFRNFIQDCEGEFVFSHFERLSSLPPSMNDALTQNILSDVYTEDLSLFPPDENAIGGRGDKTLKLLLTIENFQFTKNKTAVHVQLQHAAIGKCLHILLDLFLLFALFSSLLSISDC